MANKKVQYDIEAVNKTDAATKAAQENIDQLEQQVDSAGESASISGLKFTEFNSALQIGSQVVQAAQAIYQGTIAVFVDYADVVRELRDVTGESAEEMSRVYQLTDDYKISTEKLIVTQKELAQQGKSLSVETLAQLSDDYLKLNSGQERSLFLLENLGREGASYADMLSQGSAKLREQAASMSESLILGDKQLQQARDLEMAQDNLNDTWGAFVMRYAPEAASWLTEIIQKELDLAERQEMAKEAGDKLWMVTGKMSKEYKNLQQAQKDAAEATKQHEQYLDDLGAAMNRHYGVAAAQAQITKEEAVAAEHLIAVQAGLAGSIDKTNDKLEDLELEEKSLLDQKQQLIDQGYVPWGKAVTDMNAKIDENRLKQVEAKGAVLAATEALINQTLMAGLDADAQLEMGRALGIISEADYLAVTGAQKLKEQYEAGVITTDRLVEKTHELVVEIGKIQSKEVEVHVKYSHSGDPGGYYGGYGGYGNENREEEQAAGTWSGIVPPGFNNDSYPVWMTSGEKYSVTPPSRVGADEKMSGAGGANVTINVMGAGDPQMVGKAIVDELKRQIGVT